MFDLFENSRKEGESNSDVDFSTAFSLFGALYSSGQRCLSLHVHEIRDMNIDDVSYRDIVSVRFFEKIYLQLHVCTIFIADIASRESKYTQLVIILSNNYKYDTLCYVICGKM